MTETGTLRKEWSEFDETTAQEINREELMFLLNMSEGNEKISNLEDLKPLGIFFAERHEYSKNMLDGPYLTKPSLDQLKKMLTGNIAGTNLGQILYAKDKDNNPVAAVCLKRLKSGAIVAKNFAVKDKHFTYFLEILVRILSYSDDHHFICKVKQGRESPSRLYEKMFKSHGTNKYTYADVMVDGTPLEQSLVNEYINSRLETMEEENVSPEEVEAKEEEYKKNSDFFIKTGKHAKVSRELDRLGGKMQNYNSDELISKVLSADEINWLVNIQPGEFWKEFTKSTIPLMTVSQWQYIVYTTKYNKNMQFATNPEHFESYQNDILGTFLGMDKFAENIHAKLLDLGIKPNDSHICEWGPNGTTLQKLMENGASGTLICDAMYNHLMEDQMKKEGLDLQTVSSPIFYNLKNIPDIKSSEAENKIFISNGYDGRIYQETQDKLYSELAKKGYDIIIVPIYDTETGGPPNPLAETTEPIAEREGVIGRLTRKKALLLEAGYEVISEEEITQGDQVRKGGCLQGICLVARRQKEESEGS